MGSKTNYRLLGILKAKDITDDESLKMHFRKQRGETTMEENFQLEKHFWQHFMDTKELDADVLKNFMYGNNPLNNLLGLVDTRNIKCDDNLRGAKQFERGRIVNDMLAGLGYELSFDNNRIDKKTFMDNFVRHVVSSPTFQNHKRINEVFELNKKRSIDGDMTNRQVLVWVNTLLKDFGIKVKADRNHYRLVDEMDLMGMLRRKYAHGCIWDSENRLGLVRPGSGMVMDVDGFVSKVNMFAGVDARGLDVGLDG
jgi:hypothetical protein